MHYNGLDAVDDCITACNLKNTTDAAGRGKCVLDVGGGLGGPARHIASNTSCNVISLELQQDCNDKAAEYTLRCGLQGQVQHVCGDVMTDEILHSLNSSLSTLTSASASASVCFDVCVSWLVFLHIADKSRLLTQCNKALRACTSIGADSSSSGRGNGSGGEGEGEGEGGGGNGLLYFEDFYRLSENTAPVPFSAADIASLKQDVYCEGEMLPTQQAYEAVLEASGFEVISFVDVTGM